MSLIGGIGGPHGRLDTRRRIQVRAGTLSPDRLTPEARAAYFGSVGTAGVQPDYRWEEPDWELEPGVSGPAADAAEKLYADVIAAEGILRESGRLGLIGEVACYPEIIRAAEAAASQPPQ